MVPPTLNFLYAATAIGALAKYRVEVQNYVVTVHMAILILLMQTVMELTFELFTLSLIIMVRWLVFVIYLCTITKTGCADLLQRSHITTLI